MRTLLPCVILVASVSAQSWLYSGPVEHRAWPGAAPEAKVTGSAAGLFMGAGYPDVVILRDGRPHLFASPGALNCLGSQPIALAPAGCTAIASMYLGRTSNGRRRDQLLVSHEAGLSAWSADAQGPKWTLLDSSGTWSSLAKLVVADLDGDGNEDIVGVGSDAHTVQVRLGSASGFGIEYATRFDDPILDVTTTRWDTDGTREIAVATVGGLWICQLDLGDPIDVPGTAATEAIVVSARRPGGEVLLLCATDATEVWHLHMIDPANPGSLVLGARGVVACVVGDVDRDGADDLMISQRCNHRALLLAQRPTNVFPFSMRDALEVPLIADSATPAPTNHVVPVFADLDGDGDADLVHAVQSARTVAVARSLFGGGPPIRLIESDAANMSGGTREAVIFETSRRDLRVSLDLERTPDFPTDATDIEVLFWMLGSEQGLPVLRCERMGSLQRIPRSATSATLLLPEWAETELLAFNMLVVQMRPIRVTAAAGVSSIAQTYRPSTFVLASDEPYPVPVLDLVRAWPSVLPGELKLQHELADREWLGDTNGGIIGGGIIGVDPPPPPVPPPGGGPPVGPG